MLKKNLQLNEKILVLIILVFSLIINQYYANRGVFPIESFAHFDIAFRIINGDIPFQDYWLVSGLLISNSSFPFLSSNINNYNFLYFKEF